LSGAVQFEMEPDGKPVVLRETEVEFVDHGASK
jgi:hypothetical protein